MKNRREFLRAASLMLSAVASFNLGQLSAAEKNSWPIGCFNRPWTRWSYDETLDGIKAAGYNLTGFLSGQKGEPFISSSATPEYLDGLKKRLAQRGITSNMAAIRFKAEGNLEDNLADLRKQVENAARMELKYLLTFGVDKPEHYELFYRLMAKLAEETEKRGISLVLKPHGGGSGASEEILRCIEKIAHPNFKIWYDAGNIIYYTGKDPLEELKPIAKYVTGFCAKDCPAPKGDVMSQFGTGKVDFAAIFTHLKSVGFNGPIMVEGVKVGDTPAATTQNAEFNRKFLQDTLARI